MRIAIALLVGLLSCYAGVAAAAAEGGFQRATWPAPAWVEDDMAQLFPNAEKGSFRKLMGVGDVPAGHTGSSRCVLNLAGSGARFGVKSTSSIKCTTTNSFFKKNNGGKVLLYAGRPLVNLARSKPNQFTGVTLRLPNEANFLGPNNGESVIFAVGAGKITFNGKVTGMKVVDWGVLTIEQGTLATVQDMTFTSNDGVRFPTVAVARSASQVYGSTFTGNTCTSVTRCHTPGVYVTEGSRIIIKSCRFASNRGHLAGAVMITSGALGTIDGNVFSENQAVNNGDFGGAIFHDFCDRDSRTNGGQSTMLRNLFGGNKSQGFGGAIRIGSPDGGCSPRINGNTFSGNYAKYIGGAIHLSYCNGKRVNLERNNWRSNRASMFNGQVGFNPTRKPGAQGGGSTGRAGCPTPTTTGSTWSGTAPRTNNKWYFP